MEVSPCPERGRFVVLRCSCYYYTQDFYDAAVMTHAKEVKEASTLGQAAGIVYKATHPITKRDDGSMKVGCGGCVPSIKESIIAKGLRPAAEFNRVVEPRISKCDTCPNQGACKTLSFDP